MMRLEALEVENRHALLLRRHFQRVRTRSRLLRRAERACDRVAAGEEGFEHRLAEVLLTDNRDFHAAFFGGTEKAPAFFRLLIFAAS
jgi:hypothetical protein